MPRQRPIFRSVLLAVILGLGAQVVVAVAVFWTVGIAEQMIRREYEREQLEIRLDGTPMIVTRWSRNYQDRTGRTLEGTPLPDRDVNRTLGGTSLAGPGEPRRRFTRPGWPERIRSFKDGRRVPIYWYFIHDGEPEGHGYFAGFDSKSKFPVGYIGAGGFRPDKPSDEDRFPVDGRKMGRQGHITSTARFYGRVEVPTYYPFFDEASHERLPPWIAYLISGDRLLEVDLRKRSVGTVMESPGIVSVGISYRAVSPEVYKKPTISSSRQHLVLRMPDEILVFNPRGGERRRYTIPAEIRGKLFSFYELSDGTAIAQYARAPWEPERPISLYWIDESDEVIRTEELALKGTPPGMSPQVESGLAALVFPVPTEWSIVTTVGVPYNYMLTGRAPSYSDALVLSVSQTWPGLLNACLLSMAAAWLCLVRQRRYGLPWTRTWVVFVFLLGVPALLGYLFHRGWPIREACSECEELVPRDRDACSVCETEFPQPAAKGIEVLA